MQLTVGDIFRRAARAVPDRPAAWQAGRPVLTFGALDRRANRLAHVLRARGVRAGDRVAWWGDEVLEVVPLFAALAKLGAVFVPVNTRLGTAEVAAVVARMRPRLMITGAEQAAIAGDLGVDVARLVEGTGSGYDLAAAVAAASAGDVVEPSLRESDPHVIFLTSGSTGAPKGAVLSHRANVLRASGGTVPRGGGTLCMFPLYHMAGWTIALGCWQMQEEVAFARADAPSIGEAIARRRCRRLYAIPAVWARLLDAGIGDWDVASVRAADTGTSTTPPGLLTRIQAALPHAALRVFYGSTEAGPGTVLAPADVPRKPGSVGLPCPGVEVRLAAGGEICVRSSFLMDGYFEDRGATAAALVDGWYHTGDLGAFDDEGYLSVVGRLRELIRTGGESVAPAEVEGALRDHPAVAEVAVVGVPDPRWGEIVCAVVVALPGASLTLEDLRAHCATRLAPFKQPRRLALVPALPRTPATGQVQRTVLVEQLRTSSE